MRFTERLVRVVLMAVLCFGAIAPVALAEDGGGTGSGTGGGTKLPTLVGISVHSVTHQSAVAVFAYTNNIGAQGSHNTQFFYATDSSGAPVPFTVKYWPSPSDARKREFELRLSGLAPESSYTVGVRAGVLANNGLTSPSSGSKTFTTAAAPVVQPPSDPPPPVTPSNPVPSPTAPSAPNSAAPKPTAPTSGAQQPPAPRAPDSGTVTDENAIGTPGASGTESGGNVPAWTDASPTTGTVGPAGDVPGSGGGTGGGKDQPLAVDYSTPSNGERNVAVDTTIVVKFTKNVVYLAVRDANMKAFSLWNGEEQVPIEILMVDDQLDFENRNFVTIRPLQALEEATRYVLRIDDTITSKSTSVMVAPVEIVFYTVGYQTVSPWLIVAGATLLLAGAAGVAVWKRRGSQAVEEVPGADVVSSPVDEQG